MYRELDSMYGAEEQIRVYDAVAVVVVMGHHCRQRAWNVVSMTGRSTQSWMTAV